MKEIPLTRGFRAFVDDEDFARVNEFRWHVAQRRHINYAQRHTREPKETRRIQHMHRFILGITDPTIQVDHIDGDGLNNTRANLRSCERSQNMRNQRKLKPATSPFKGVYLEKNRRANRWCAQIWRNNKQLKLGRFATEEEAARAYNTAASKYGGEFARLNRFPGSGS